MQHTLIPTADRDRLHREYFMRALTILFCMVALSILVGAGFLFPAYIRAWLANRSSETAIAASSAIKEESGIDADRAELETDNAIAAAASAPAGPSFATAVRQVISARKGVTVASFAMTRPDPKTVAIAVRGVAPTRDDLLSFGTRLEAAFPGASIDIPIGQLAKSANLPFSIQFTETLP